MKQEGCIYKMTSPSNPLSNGGHKACLPVKSFPDVLTLKAHRSGGSQKLPASVSSLSNFCFYFALSSREGFVPRLRPRHSAVPADRQTDVQLSTFLSLVGSFEHNKRSFPPSENSFSKTHFLVLSRLSKRQTCSDGCLKVTIHILKANRTFLLYSL